MTTHYSEAMKRLAHVRAIDVKCPVCVAQSAQHQTHWRVAGPCRDAKGQPLKQVHPERKALARKVAGILRAHFVVAERACNGEAHSNPHIDHCSVCAPRWGVVEYLRPIAAVESQTNVVARAFATVEKADKGCDKCGATDKSIDCICAEPLCGAAKDAAITYEDGSVDSDPVERREVEVKAAGAAMAPNADLDATRAALLVMVTTPATLAWLTEHDPMALRQARKALGLAEPEDRNDTKGRTLPTDPNVSWKPEVIADSSGQWCGNALRFATKEEAEANVFNLMMRWMLVRDTRVVESTDPVNYAWDVERGLVDLVRKES